MRRRPAQRIRVRLLVLLWLWAGCVFLVVDLFWNVQEFDGIRPRADIYRATRYVAHRMVGEPWRDGSLVDPAPVRVVPPDREATLGERLRIAGTSGDTELLAAVARRDSDPRVRACALRRLARVGGAAARPILRKVVADADELDKVRAEAARALGATGDDVRTELEALTRAGQPTCVRRGAVGGLACVGSPEAIACVVDLAHDPALGGAIEAAVRSSRSPLHRPILAETAAQSGTPVCVRVAACAALAHGRQAPAALCALVTDDSVPDEVRAAAARALGSIGDPGALPALALAAQGTGSPAWAREVRRADARLRSTG